MNESEEALQKDLEEGWIWIQNGYYVGNMMGQIIKTCRVGEEDKYLEAMKCM